MKKYILTFIISLLAGTSIAMGDDMAQIGDKTYETLQEAIDDIPTNGTATITLLCDVTEGSAFQIRDSRDNETLNITIDFAGHTYTVTNNTVGSSGTTNQAMHFAGVNNILTLTSSTGRATITTGDNVDGLKIMMQNYCNLTINNVNIDCSHVTTQTYSGYTGDDAAWNGKTRPKFNFNSGTSSITNSTITFGNDDQFGVLADKEVTAASLTIGDGTTINGNVTALGGNATIEGDNIIINGNVLVDKVETNQSTGSITIKSGTINGSALYNYGTLTIPTTSTATFPNAVAKVLSNNTINAPKCYATNFEDAVKNGIHVYTIYLLKDIGDYTLGTTLNPSTNAPIATIKVAANGHSINVLPGDDYYLNSQPYTTTESGKSNYVTYSRTAQADAAWYFTNDNGTEKYEGKTSTSWSSNGTYKLLQDVSVIGFSVGQLATNVTIDLNGHTLTTTVTENSQGVKQSSIKFPRTGTETSPLKYYIVDNSENKGGKIVAQPGANDAIIISGDYNELTIGEGVIIAGNSVVIAGNSSDTSENNTLTVKGTINAGNTFAVSTNGAYTTNATINIEDGAVLTSDNVAVYLPATGTCTVSGGEITGATGVYVKSGTTTITGGVIKGTGAQTAFEHLGDGANSTGDAFVVENCGYPGGTPSVSISGGTFISTNADPIASYTYGDGNDPIAGFVSGGTFSSAVPEEFCAQGYIPTEANPDTGLYSVTQGEYVAQIGNNKYATLAAAIAAAQDGETITLLKDCSGGGLFIGPNKFTTDLIINFGGFTYTVTTPVGSTNTVNQALHFEQGNKITLTNGAIKMTTDATALTAFEMFMQNYGTLIIDGMTIDGTGIEVATYASSYGTPWGGTTKPQFNYNTAGNSVIRNSTITMTGDLGIDDSAALTIEDDAIINVNKIVTKGTDARYASANPTITVENGAQFKLADADGAAAFETLLNTMGQTLGTAVNGVYTVAAATFVASITVSGTTTNYPTLEAAIAAVGNGQQIDLLANVTLSSDAVCTLTDGQYFQLDFKSHTVTKGNYSVQLAKGVMAKTTATTDIFSTVEGAQIVYGVTHANAQHYAYYAATTMTDVAYINHQGNSATTTAVVIDSRMDEMQTLEEDGWFVANSNVTLTFLTRIGTNNTDYTCNFILADGKTLTLGDGTGYNFGGSNSRYAFFGQTNQTGKLELGRPLNALSLTQNGGKIGFVNTVNAWISADVVIRNGEMNLVSSHTTEPILGSSQRIEIIGGVVKVYATGGDGIAMKAGDIIITGGQVEAIAEGNNGKGMVATNTNTITLSLRDPAQYPDDYIKATNYDGVVKIANGKTLYDSDNNNTPYTGDGTATVDNNAIANHTLRASNQISINAPSITVTVEPATYTGSAITPVVTVSGATAPLVAGTDYEISFDGTYTNAKTYSNAITITGIGGYYTGTRKADFVINPRSINDVTVTGNTQAYTGTAYTADQISAAIVLTYNTNTLTAGATDDYTISVAAGTYQAPGTYPGVITLTAVEGEGKNFVGSRTVDFIIQDAINIADCDIIATTVYNGQEQTPAATVVVKSGGTVVASTNYTITYDGTPNFTNVGTTQITVTGAGNSYFGSKVVDYVISPKDISECAVNNSTAFTGAVIDPATVVTVTDGSTELSSTTDYTLTVSQGYTYQNPQTYTGALTITGKGNYTGTVIKDFVIASTTAKPLAGHVIVVSKQTYTGASLAPTSATTTVTYDDGTPLTAGTDYTFSYVNDNNTVYKDAKTYSNAITITGKGETYYGSVTADYVIEARNMNEVTATEVNKMNWTGSPINPIINGDDASTNNISLTYGSYKLKNDQTVIDYTYTVEPSSIVDPGVYTITFEGRGNFTGTTRLDVHVQKDISHETVAVNIDKLILPNGTTWSETWVDLPLVVQDGNITLTIGTDYDLEVYSDVALSTETKVMSITGDGIYYAKLIGKNNYKDFKSKKFYVLNEYYGMTANDNSIAADLHLTEVTTGGVIAKLGNAVNNDADDANDTPVISDATTVFAPSAQPTVTCGTETINLTLVGIETGAFKNCTNLTGLDISGLTTITEVQNGAFEGCTALRYIDLSTAEGFTPSSLQRNIAASPFNGVPKQALVYLHGTTFTGENYVYKPDNSNAYYCEKFKIYDDLSGSQTGFTGDDYKWAYENIHPFMAYTIENTRMLTAGKHYTTCLPYTLAIPADMKAYTLDATSDKLFGFSEVTGIISAFTPYVLIPSKSGQLLSTVTTTVPVFTETTTTDPTTTNPVTTYSPQLGSTTKGNFTLYGTMRYMDGTTAEGKYIMQYGGGSSTWLQVTGSYSYSNPCILPMRAYIAPSGSGARSYTATFTDVDGKQLTSDMLLDADDSMYYDLQGRKVDTPQRKGLYIKSSVEGKNGRKVIKRR